MPALWHHAVASEPGADGLNVAANLWFVPGDASHAAALARAPPWPAAEFCRAAALRALGDPKAAAAASSAPASASADAKLWAASYMSGRIASARPYLVVC